MEQTNVIRHTKGQLCGPSVQLFSPRSVGGLHLWPNYMGRWAPDTEEFVADSRSSSLRRSAADAAETMGAARSGDCTRSLITSSSKRCRRQTPSQNHR